MKLSVQIKLLPDEDQALALRTTLREANRAANFISRIAWEQKTFGQYSLQKISYAQVRASYKLPAQLTVRVTAKVADAYKLDRKKMRTFKPLGSVAFDSRNFSLFVNKSLASISTLAGRVKVPFTCGERQRTFLANSFGEADLCLIKDEWYLFVSVNLEDPPIEITNNFLGVDLGIVNIATDSDGHVQSGEAITRVRKRFSSLRQRLQKRGTKNSRRHLVRLKKKEQNFVKTINHTVSKRIVGKAKDTCRSIALEDLRGIGKATVRRSQRYLHKSWAFGQLRNFIRYKALMAGVLVALVNPEYTSQTCPECGYVARGNRISQAIFRCLSCGFAGHADHIAARNIRARATVNWPNAGIGLLFHILLPQAPGL